MLWQLLFIVLGLWIALEQWRRRKILAFAAKVPSARGRAYPLVGNALSFLGSDQDRMKTFVSVGEDATSKGGFTGFWFGRELFLVCTDAAHAEVILKNCLDKNDLMNYIRELTGNGIIFADVNVWRPRRKVMAPAFSPKTLNQFTEIFSRQSQILAQQLEKASNGESFSAWKYLNTYTMDAVCETNLGVSVSAQLNADNQFLTAFEGASQVLAARVCQPWLQLELVYPWTNYFKQMRRCRSQLYTFIEDIIRKKRKDNDNKANEAVYNSDDNTDETKKDSPFTTLLEKLIENSGGSKGYTDIELREETLVIAIAGSDTSAVGACFTLCMLARYPKIQEMVYEEIQEVFGTSDRAITHEDLPRLKYLEAVVKESLRLYPPVPVIVRKVEKEVTLPSGLTLVPGVGILIHIYGIHRNPKYWGDDADKFEPERFLEKLSHPAAFIPFSHGPRNCLGYQYAMISMKTAVSSIVRKYRILPPKTNLNGTTPSSKVFRLKFDIMMKDEDGFQLRLEKRN